MSTGIIRPVGYVGSLQQLVIPATFSGYVQAYLWGAGGGCGGWDGSGAGGDGSGGGYAVKTFSASPGDTIVVAVGGAGGAGESDISSGGGGGAGDSYIGSGFSYSGAFGGSVANVQSAGAAAGGGGATVLLYNGSVLAVAGGGGGGGGSSSGSTKALTNAPGPRGQEPLSNAGENGSNAVAPGGGGGGGYFGGNGGLGGVHGEGGSYGTSYGDVTANPTNWRSAGFNSEYYSYVGLAGSGSQGGYGIGGTGRSGAAVFVFYGLGGIWVHDGVMFNPVQNVYIKHNSAWSLVQNLYQKQAGVWSPTNDSQSYAPTFGPLLGNWGIDPRGGIPS